MLCSLDCCPCTLTLGTEDQVCTPQVDTPRLQQVKTLIRYTEATSAAGVCGVPEERAHFLDMPFYETGALPNPKLTCLLPKYPLLYFPLSVCDEVSRHGSKEGALR